MSSTSGYREQVYIVKDVILTLSEYGELNQTALVSYCGLNLKKHKHILDKLEKTNMITKSETQKGKRTIIIYKPTPEGLSFCRSILEPYEDIFPRKTKSKQSSSGMQLLILI